LISWALVDDQAREFLRNAKANPKWVQDNLIQFISYQNEKAKCGKISVYTIPNYYRATKLFCEMNDIILGWKNYHLTSFITIYPVDAKDGSIFSGFLS